MVATPTMLGSNLVHREHDACIPTTELKRFSLYELTRKLYVPFLNTHHLLWSERVDFSRCCCMDKTINILSSSSAIYSSCTYWLWKKCTPSWACSLCGVLLWTLVLKHKMPSLITCSTSLLHCTHTQQK